MFKQILVAAAVFGFVATSALADAGAVKAKESDGHCEKKENGKTTDIAATDKTDCKSKGGRWSKGKAHGEGKDHKDETNHEDHEHKDYEK